VNGSTIAKSSFLALTCGVAPFSSIEEELADATVSFGGDFLRFCDSSDMSVNLIQLTEDTTKANVHFHDQLPAIGKTS
jgi:hypothetical protein